MITNPRPLVRSLASVALVAAGATVLVAQTSDVGLDPGSSVLLTNENLIFYTPQTSDLFGFALAAGDFDGNGADDLATGIPLDDGRVFDPVADCGGVVVRYGTVGSRFDPDRAATTFLSQQQTGSPSAAEAGEKHGRAVAAGDFNGDGYDDLAIGAPGNTSAEPVTHAGAVFIHYGSASGVSLVAQHLIDLYTLLGPSYTGADQQDGYTLAVGDFDADGYDDLAVGSPFYFHATGSVWVLHGGADGLLPASWYFIWQGNAAIVDDPENDDRFGYALAAGDFDGDSHDDLAIGVPGEDGSGAVEVLFGSQFGLLFATSVIYREFDLGLSTGAGDEFGAALASGDFDGDGRDDLAIGAPYLDVVRSLPQGDVTFADAGWVTTLYGGAGGFDFTRTQHWSQGTVFPRTASEDQDHFGQTLAAGDFDVDGRADLAIGVPGESLTPLTTGLGDGEVDVVSGSPAGLDVLRRRAFREGFDSLAGDAAQHHKLFGFALAVGDFDGNERFDLAVGVPYRDADGVADVGAEIVISAFAPLPFGDDFETGGTARWSATEPLP